MDLYKFVQLSARIPLVILGIYLSGTFLGNNLLDRLDQIPHMSDVRGLSMVLEVTLSAFALTVVFGTFIAFAYNNLHAATVLLVAIPSLFLSIKLVVVANTWRLVAVGIYSSLLLTLLPFAVTRRLEPAFQFLRPQPRPKELAALFTLYGVILFIVVTKAVFPELAHNQYVLLTVRNAGPYLVGVPLAFILDLAALQAATARPGAARNIGTIALVVVAIPVWYPLLRLLYENKYL